MISGFDVNSKMGMPLKAALLLCTLLATIAAIPITPVSATTVSGLDLNGPLAPVRIYVLQLDGVGTLAGVNTTQIFEGITDISKNRTIEIQLDFDTFAYPTLNTILKVVREWSEYERLITTEANFVLVNGHHEYLPVPNGYSKEEWLETVSEALADRYLVWVHLAGYPFSNAWHENGGTEVWGEAGFSLFVSFIGKPAVSLQPPVERESEMTGFLAAGQYSGWWRAASGYGSDFSCCRFFYTEWLQFDLFGSYPLVRDYLGKEAIFWEIYLAVATRWSGVDYVQTVYYPGVVLQYQKPGATTYGLYVHFTASKFYDWQNGDGAEPDYAKGVMSVYAALSSEILTPAFRIWEADDAVRTTGVPEAARLLADAVGEYGSGNYLKAAHLAQLAIDTARNPPDRLSAWLAVAVATTVGVPVAALAILLRNRRTKPSAEPRPFGVG